jgi:hypothetical protein
MSAVFSPNKNFIEPASGSFTNAWASPVNSNWSIIDEALGGVTTINVTGVETNVELSISQYQPPNIVFTGTLSTNLIYQLPTGVGGLWSVSNNTTGAFALIMNSAGAGRAVTLTQGGRAFIVCDATNVDLADTQPAASALAAAETFATTAANTAQSNAISTSEAFTTSFASNAANITTGTVTNARLPNVAAGPGVTIQADPGTTPSGTFGDIFFFF